MSQLSNSKGKDAGRKYTSLNVNQTYKGTKGESKSNTGSGTRHGLQSLGKIGQSRRAPIPANLPSLKSENSGNDPRINLVPSGSQGWAKKEKTETISTGSTIGQLKPKPEERKEISLRPNAGATAPPKTTITGSPDNQEGGKPTWGGKVQPPSGPSVYFQKEFPILGADGNREEAGKERDQLQEGEQSANHQAMGHPAYTNGQKWTEKQSGPMQLPPNFAQFAGDRPMFNGNQQPPYPFPFPQMYAAQGGRGMPMPYPYPYQYPPGGKIPQMDPRYFPRVKLPYKMATLSSQSDRPSVVKDSDLKSLDNHESLDDAGWAGSQEEVDYNAKLKFDESDESDDDDRSKHGEKSRSPSDKDAQKKKQQEAWAEFRSYPPHMQMAAFNQHQNWHRMQYPGFDPQRGPPPSGYPIHPMYFMNPYAFPQNMPPPGPEKSDEMQKKDKPKEGKDSSKEGKVNATMNPDDRKDIDRKAAAQEKLRKLDEQMQKRTPEEQKKLEEQDRNHSNRSRNDSEASDSSRREIPPRFQRQQSGSHHQSQNQPHTDRARTISENSQMKIMQRKDSFNSNDSVTQEEEGLRKERNTSIENTDKSSALYHETTKSEQQKRHSSSSYESHEKSSRHGSTSSLHSKDEDRGDGHDKTAIKKELKDLSSHTRDKDYELPSTRVKEKSKRDTGKTSDAVDGKHSSIGSERFSEMKLIKGQSKHDKSPDKKIEKFAPPRKEVPERRPPSAWSKIVSGEKQAKSVDGSKTLREIQKEEEREEQERLSKSDKHEKQDAGEPGIDHERKARYSPSENKFRSDFYDKQSNQRNSRDDKFDKPNRPERRGRFTEDSNRRGSGRYDREDNRNNYDERRNKFKDYDGSRRDDRVKRDSRYNKEGDRIKRDSRYEKVKDDDWNKKDAKYEKEGDRNRRERRYEKDDERSYKDNRESKRNQDNHRQMDKNKDKDNDTKKEDIQEDLVQKKNSEKLSDSLVKEDKSSVETGKIEKNKDQVIRDHKGDRRAERREEFAKDEYKKDRRYDSREKRRDDFKQEDRYDKRGNGGRRDGDADGEQKGYDRRKPNRNEDSKKDDYNKHEKRETYRSERDGKRFSDRKTYEDNRKQYDDKRYDSGRKRNEWNNRDYRLSEEYPQEFKRKQGKEEKKENDSKKEDQVVHSIKETSESLVEDTSAKATNEVTNEKSTGSSVEKADKSAEPTVEKEKRLTNDVSQTNKNKGGFGVPSDRSRDRKVLDDQRDDSRSTRGRGRGRGSARSRLSNSGKFDRSESRGGSRYSKSGNHDSLYEDVSSGEFTDEDESHKSRPKYVNDNKDSSKKPERKSWDTERPPRFEVERPPRFQQKYEDRERGGYRGRGRGTRGSDRSRGRSRGRGITSTRSVSRPVGELSRESKHNDEGNEDDSEDFYSAEESTDVKADDTTTDDTAKVRGHGTEYARGDRNLRARHHGTYRPGRGGRGSSVTTERVKSFLAKRQQVGSRRTSFGNKDTPSAADKSTYSKGSEVQESTSRNNANLDDISAHSPPKKVKPAVEKKEDKKRDISREFDLNNIRSVVCIDDMASTSDQQKSTEEDGFVTVTSRKQQKELRDRQREEEKRKLLLEQKKEAQKAQKAKKEANKNSAHQPSKGKPVPFADASISAVGVDQVTIASPPTAPVSIPAPPASNVAMAAMGVWEPAQYLTRSQQSVSISGSDTSKQSMQTSASTVNAWQRPLTLTDSSMPDPRAVGTGKPSSAHPGLLNKSSLVPNQPTPEAASPLVTPPALAPIGSSSIPVSIPNKIHTPIIKPEKVTEDVPNEPSKSKEEKSGSDQNRDKKRRERAEKDRSGDHKRESKSSISKRTRDKPPRFQTAPKKDIDERSRSRDETRKSGSNRQLNADSKSRKRSADRHRKEPLKSQSEIKSSKPKKIIEKGNQNDGDGVFTDLSPDSSNQTTSATARKSKLSDADKVVGSNKPSLKSQSSIGSHSAEERVVEVKIADTYQAPNQISSDADERKGNNTRLVIKSLNEDEERSLETRSLPGSPPLAVKIPEPTLAGPASDPGRVPSPSIAQEMNNLNLRLLSAKKAWDDLPSTSDTAVSSSTFSVVSTSSIQSQPVQVSSNLPSPTKSEPVVHTIANVKKAEEKVPSSANTFVAKRSEQQVCKVKPQQQLPQEESKNFQPASHHSNQIHRREMTSTSKYTSYVLPIDRSLQQNALYTSDARYSEQLRNQANQPLNFQSLNQVRSVDNSVSPLSNQLLSSFPLGSIYGTTQLQQSQNPTLAWQVVSTANVPTAKTLTAYQDPNQASLFTSAGSLGSSPFIMQQYETNFSQQRNASTMHRQPLNVLPVPQQQQAQNNAAQPASMVIPTNSQNHMRRQAQRYHGIGADPNQMAMISQAMNNQRSDMIKHVNAKPFEPTSQTPPLVQSPPVMAQQSVQSLHQHQQVIQSAYNQPTSVARPQYVQNMTRYSSQPVLQQRQHNVQPLQQNPLVASVRPQPVQGRLLTGSQPAPNQNRVTNVSPFDPTLGILNTLGMKTNNLQIHLSQQQRSINNQIAQQAMQQQNQPQQYQQRTGLRVANVQQNRTNGLGPIQRPATHVLHNQVPNHTVKTYSAPAVQPAASLPGVDFKNIQRKKMLEDTKRYFETEQKSVPHPTDPDKVLIDEKSETTPITNPNLSKHDKFILPESTKELKRFDFNKKSQTKSADSKNQRRRNGSTKNSSTASSSSQKKPIGTKQRNSSKV